MTLTIDAVELRRIVTNVEKSAAREDSRRCAGRLRAVRKRVAAS